MASQCGNETKDQFNKEGNFLVSDQYNNRVIEFNPRGEIVWHWGIGPDDFSVNSAIGVRSAERVGHLTLLACSGIAPGVTLEAKTGIVDNRVLLLDKEGKIEWQYGQFGLIGTSCNLLNVPVHATVIPCSTKCKKNSLKCANFLITDHANNRVIRVNREKEIIWQYPGTNVTPADQLNGPNSAHRLKNGHYLIADGNNHRAIEVDRSNNVVKVFTASGTLGVCGFASRLPNGNTLLTDSTNNKVVEVDTNDEIVWQYITDAEAKSMSNPIPTRAVRLDDGDTLIADQFNNRVIRTNYTIVIDSYGLPVTGVTVPGTTLISTNKGFSPLTTQLGLYAPASVNMVGDYTGIRDY